MSTRLIELVERLPHSRIVLLGDLMLDRYLYGDAERLSQEAPVPVLHFQHEQSGLGGAGRVVEGLAALGAQVRVVGLIGADGAGGEVRRLLSACGASTDTVIEAADRPTICKTRLVGLAQHRHPQQMIRLDYEDASPVNGGLAARILDHIAAALDSADALCIEDYDKGLVTDDICRRAIHLARERNIPVFVDPGPIADFSKYTGASSLKPNRPEIARASDLPVTSDSEYRAAAQWMLDQLQLDAAIITLDKDGAYLATRDGEHHWLRNRQLQVYDVTGADDTFLSMLTVARTAGAPWLEAATLANIAGGLECEKFGSVPITPQEVIAELLAASRAHLGKQRTLETLLPELSRHRAGGKRIVFTNGCFDLIHLGHVKYFQFAKSQGDLLVVGVNTDSSIRRLKGDKRPIINEHDRISVLEELESIDYLVRFDDDTPLRLIDAIKPDVLVKGADYAKQEVVGWDVVEAYGGQVSLAPLVDGRSTTSVIQRILEAYR